MTNKKAVYLRISRDKGEGIADLENHRNILIRLCESKGYQYELFQEVISGASNFEDRVQLNNLLNRLDEFDGLICIATDRLSRDMEYSARVFKALEKANIPIITPERTYTEQDTMMFYLEAMMANQEYKMITKRMKRGKIEGARKGLWTTGQAPLGYKIVDKKLEINEDEATVVRLIFNLYENGYGRINVAQELSSRGILTKRGNHYSSNAVGLILNNETYIGNSTLNITGGETIYNQGTHQAIVTLEQFLKCKELSKERLSGAQEVKTRTRGKVLSVLKDLMYCNICGSKLGIYTKGGKLHLRSCSTKSEGKTCTNSSILESNLVEHFWLEMQEYEEALFHKYSTMQVAQKVDTKALLQEEYNSLMDKKTVLERKFKRVREGYENELYSMEDFKLAKVEYDSNVKQINLTLQELDSRIQMDNPKRELLNLEERLEKLKAKEDMSIEEMNTFLKTIIHKVHYERTITHEEDVIAVMIEFKGL